MKTVFYVAFAWLIFQFVALIMAGVVLAWRNPPRRVRITRNGMEAGK